MLNISLLGKNSNHVMVGEIMSKFYTALGKAQAVVTKEELKGRERHSKGKGIYVELTTHKHSQILKGCVSL